MKTPEWTEIGNTSGLDPLGMMRPSEQVYQPLLSGVSTVTNRLRYYSFLTWFLYFYASEYSDKNIKTFREVLRHAEALYALLSSVDESDHGLSGSRWVSRFKSNNSMTGVISFGDSSRNQDTGLLQNQGGALAAIYGAQMAEMGLVKRPEAHKIMVPTNLGLTVAEAFKETLGDQEEKFVQAIKTGVVDSKDLESFRTLRPSDIQVGTSEWRVLKDALLGIDEFETNISAVRRDSLKRMLSNSLLSQEWPEAENLRWNWYTSQIKSKVPDNWLAYHINDILLFAYEALLKYSLELMRSSPDKTIAWSALIEKFMSCLEDPDSDFMGADKLDGSEHEQVLTIAERGSEKAAMSEEDVKVAIILVKKSLNWAEQNKSFVEEVFQHSDHFQSMNTELRFVQSLSNKGQANVLTDIISSRILKRHLWVAARKFRSDSKYTFLFEPYEGALRFKESYSVWMGYPRIAPALRFLADLDLIEDGKGLTSEGKKVLSEL